MRTIVAVGLLFLAGCGMNRQIQEIETGMSEPEVVAIMGQPDGAMQEGEYRALQWSNRLMSGWSWDRADYWVVLEDGRVTSYGPGEVRQNQAGGALVLIPVH